MAVLGVLTTTALAGCGASTSNTAGAGGATNSTGSQTAEKTSAIGLTAKVDPNATPSADKIVIATDNTYPPMEYMDPSDPTKLVGFDVDLGDALSKYLHKDIVWKPTQWDGIIAGLTSDKYDIIISSMNDTAERRKQIDFVDYGSWGQAIVVKKNSTANIQSLKDLEGKTVGVQIATTSDDLLSKDKAITVKRYNTFPDAFQDLANGRLDAAVVDEAVARYYVNLQPDNYKIVGQTLDSLPVGIGIRKDEQSLEKSLQDALNQMKADGTYDKIYTYWFGQK
ncbi:basic amino acid ABC transporter substrate-binding protein [Alicyclobacillus contaminans]|uniref:basic amino acid ABC transporter substrate-binding protein n=1 Tax=Alicyclobacillus contaminans TaxID=392016 RepID=UPI00040A3DFE|nr:basic amino acid ABC transporter substrate-binding protein [Alicyclobacillus contaminans]